MMKAVLEIQFAWKHNTNKSELITFSRNYYTRELQLQVFSCVI